MKVFVAGATGAIGRPLIAQLLAKGHDVVALTRSSEKAKTLAKQGVEPAIVDIFDADVVKAAVIQAQPEVVIEQLTALPKTYTGESMSAAAHNAHIITELEQRLLETPTIEGIALRYGFFYGPGTWFAPDGDVANRVRQQQFPIIGNGEGVWSWLHIEDAAIATVAAAERGDPGIYLITDDRPLPVQKWLSAFARWLDASPPPQISVEEALQVGGADAVYYGIQMRGASNTKARRELGFQPRSLEWLVDTAVARAN